MSRVSREQILSAILTELKSNMKNNEINEKLIKILYNLEEDGNLSLHTRKEFSAKTNIPFIIRGFFSSADNELCLVVNEEKIDFQKFLFVKYGDPVFNQEEIEAIIKTFRHELMHYAATNALHSFKNIWGKNQFEFYKLFFTDICLYHGDVFHSPKKYSSVNELYSDKYFTSTIKKYISSVRLTDLIRYSSYISLYTTIGSYMYRNTPLSWARFIDEVMTGAIDAGEGRRNKKTMIIFKVLADTYFKLWPQLKTSRAFMNNIFYQELLIPSEISSMCSEGYELNLDIKKCVDKTLDVLL